MRIKFYILIFLAVLTKDIFSQQHLQEGYLIMDMVHHNPGEYQTQSVFRNPEKLASYNYNGMVINEFKFPHCAVTFDSFDKRIFPEKSEELKWAENLTTEIRNQIKKCHNNGLAAYYFLDIIVLPKKMVELYKDEICDDNGRISFEKPKTWEIHRKMIKELFERFPDMDGLVIRTGETYTHNIPYHLGNGPVDYRGKYDKSIEIHARLIQLLRDEVCTKLNKKIIYRTWDFGFFHTRLDYYLAVTNKVEPHPNLYISIKHTDGDYFRTFGFNKTITLGNHKQVIEVQCQREYEGKGAYPNYIANAVISGFEENKGAPNPHSLNDIKNHPLFAGVWTWSRGGGWHGPYITNEFWCDINTYVMAQWAKNTERSEEEIFNEYALKEGITPESISYFRKLCLLTPDAIIRGRGSLIHSVNVGWTRDHYLGGINQNKRVLDEIIDKDIVDESLYEMKTATAIWQDIVELSKLVSCNDKVTEKYICISAQYGYLLHAIMEQGWIVMLRGYEGDKKGKYDTISINLAINKYDQLWENLRKLKENNPECATLYHDKYIEWDSKDREKINLINGMGESVDRYRHLTN